MYINMKKRINGKKWWKKKGKVMNGKEKKA